uniref:Transcription Factor n=1 Tax=Florenciella sp. virus SA2 TaxID=3240092 RepID=A0AB39J7B2_9VIRU
MNDEEIVKPPRKPRKPRTKKADMIKKVEAEQELLADNVKVPKKRGRKPKGGKVVKSEINNISHNNEQPIISILHLKCKISDLTESKLINYDIEYNPNIVNNIEPYANENNYCNFDSSVNDNLSKNGNTVTIADATPTGESASPTQTDNKAIQKNKKNILNKLKELEKDLNTNNIPKTSACFWCTYDFTSNPIYIPSLYFKKKYDVYGCFCSPECACAYLFKENIDENTKFERYQLLNYLYGNIYDYKKEIKMAPDPYYTLNKFYGNLTIQEYRQLLDYDRLLLVINKPVTKIFPEIHEDNNDFETVYENKLKLKKTLKNDKNYVLNNVFSAN